MSMTITEKILAAHCGKERVEPGEIIMARVDVALANDITAPLAISAFERTGAPGVFDKGKVVLVMDHFVPNKDIKSAAQCQLIRQFAQRQGLKHFYDVGRMGVEHALLPEQGLVLPGDVVVGADSHTCTYGALGAFSTGMGSTDLGAAMTTGEVWLKVPESMRFTYTGRLKPWVGGKDLILHTIGDVGVDGALYRAMEFAGEVLENLPMSDRMTMCNMAIEAGGKSGIIAPDATTETYVKERARREYRFFVSDEGARYADKRTYDVSQIELQVALPPLPEKSMGISMLGRVPIDQAVIGSCTNGRLEDLRVAADILRGRKVASGVRCIIIPATQAIYAQALAEGLLAAFVEAEAAVSTPTCGPCLGGHMGILAEGERCIATTNRNFVGRMGHPKSEVYLSGPAVAAASAVAGYITGPDGL
ncbi:MAG: 3-isopropylmalate dehydratase large subunit [Pseudomonadota bacterium]